MRSEDQVCCLELAQKLKELGIDQESLFYWIPDSNGRNRWGLWHYLNCPSGDVIKVAAYSVAELGELLPDWIRSVRSDGYWRTEYRRTSDVEEWHHETERYEADARANMLIYLLKNNLLEE